MNMLVNLLRWYALLDVCPFLEALLVNLGHYQKWSFNLFKMLISLLGILLHWAFDTIENYDMAKAMHCNLTGGPSIVYHRFPIKGQTSIHGNRAYAVQMTICLDVNT